MAVNTWRTVVFPDLTPIVNAKAEQVKAKQAMTNAWNNTQPWANSLIDQANNWYTIWNNKWQINRDEAIHFVNTVENSKWNKPIEQADYSDNDLIKYIQWVDKNTVKSPAYIDAEAVKKTADANLKKVYWQVLADMKAKQEEADKINRWQKNMQNSSSDFISKDEMLSAYNNLYKWTPWYDVPTTWSFYLPVDYNWRTFNNKVAFVWDRIYVHSPVKWVDPIYYPNTKENMAKLQKLYNIARLNKINWHYTQQNDWSYVRNRWERDNNAAYYSMPISIRLDK